MLKTISIVGMGWTPDILTAGFGGSILAVYVFKPPSLFYSSVFSGGEGQKITYMLLFTIILTCCFTHITLNLQLCLILFIIFWTVRVPQQSFLEHCPQVGYGLKHFDIWPVLWSRDPRALDFTKVSVSRDLNAKEVSVLVSRAEWVARSHALSQILSSIVTLIPSGLTSRFLTGTELKAHCLFVLVSG